MIHFHPNGLDTSSLSQPAKQLLHAAILLGLQQGDQKTHVVLKFDLLRKAGLEPAATAQQMKALLVECTKALGLFDSEKVTADQERDDVLDASCPVFQFVTLFDGEVSYRLERPIYTLSEQDLNHLLPTHPPKITPRPLTAAPRLEEADAPATAQIAPNNPVDLTVAIRVLWQLAHDDGDLGAHYWQSVINLLTSVNEMHAELLELRQRAGARR